MWIQPWHYPHSVRRRATRRGRVQRIDSLPGGGSAVTRPARSGPARPPQRRCRAATAGGNGGVGRRRRWRRHHHRGGWPTRRPTRVRAADPPRRAAAERRPRRLCRRRRGGDRGDGRRGGRRRADAAPAAQQARRPAVGARSTRRGTAATGAAGRPLWRPSRRCRRAPVGGGGGCGRPGCGARVPWEGGGSVPVRHGPTTAAVCRRCRGGSAARGGAGGAAAVQRGRWAGGRPARGAAATAPPPSAPALPRGRARRTRPACVPHVARRRRATRFVAGVWRPAPAAALGRRRR